MYHVEYTVPAAKISAIKAVRQVFSIGLKEAKDLIESDGFLVTEAQWLAIMHVYIASSTQRRVCPNDFTVQFYPALPKPTDMTAYGIHGAEMFNLPHSTYGDEGDF